MILRRTIIQSRSFAALASRREGHSHLPRVASPEIWRSIIPKFMRRRQSQDEVVSSNAESRAGIALIVLGLVAGSFAINIISLRREILNFTRQTETKLALLREVIDSVKRGEEVDVKRLLGTGDPQSEAEWEAVIQELEGSVGMTAKRTRKLQRQQQRESEASAAREGPPQQEAERSKPKFMM